jgi:hypothetical protein
MWKTRKRRRQSRQTTRTMVCKSLVQTLIQASRPAVVKSSPRIRATVSYTQWATEQRRRLEGEKEDRETRRRAYP